MALVKLIFFILNIKSILHYVNIFMLIKLFCILVIPSYTLSILLMNSI